MKKALLLILALTLVMGSYAQEQKRETKKGKIVNEKGEIIKKG